MQYLAVDKRKKSPLKFTVFYLRQTALIYCRKTHKFAVGICCILPSKIDDYCRRYMQYIAENNKKHKSRLPK